MWRSHAVDMEALAAQAERREARPDTTLACTIRSCQVSKSLWAQWPTPGAELVGCGQLLPGWRPRAPGCPLAGLLSALRSAQ